MPLRIWFGSVLCLVLLMPYGFADELPEQATGPTDDEKALSSEPNPEGDAGEADFEQLRQMLRQLQRQIAEMEQQHAAEIEKLKREIEAARPTEPETNAAEEDELRMLREAAEAAVGKPEEEQKEPEETVFKAGSLSLQALNPEISVTGDMVTFYRDQEDAQKRSDFDFRNLGIHIESYLDPYTRFKSAVEVHEDGVELGEAYMTRFGLLPDVNLTLGKFRQQFGVVNRWHKHGLDQVDFPLALRNIFGDGGLNQTGVSLDWTLPPIGETAHQLTFQVTNGENDRLFDENSRNVPSLLLHYKNFRDLTKDTYLEFGLTNLVGWNDEWPVLADGDTWRTERERLETWVWGGDFTVLWEPTERMRYRNLEWRTEAYYLRRGVIDPYDLDEDTVNAWGAYSYIQTKLTRTWDVGVRCDYYEPDRKRYAGLPQISLAPLAVTSGGAYRWQVGPYVTWFQSPFVKFRLEYNHGDGAGVEKAEDVVYFQMIFSAGPHKHERY